MTTAVNVRENDHDAAPESGRVSVQRDLYAAFEQIVHERRAVRAFDTSISDIPDEVFERAIELALLAPSSSNLQPWQFVRVKSPALKAKMVPLCLNFPSAVTATELIVCAGRIDRWRRHTADLIDLMKRRNITLPPPFDEYYTKLVPLTYVLGPFGSLGLLKRVISGAIRLVRPLSVAPFTHADMKSWSLYNTALATMILMLAYRAQGYDTCPISGFDPGRVKTLVGLPRSAQILAVLCVGKRAPEDQIYGPRIRLPRSEFVTTV